VEGEKEAGAEGALDGFRVEEAREGVGLVGERWEGVVNELGVEVAANLEGADIGLGELEAGGGGNPAPGPVENLFLPDDLERAANPMWILFGAGPALPSVPLHGVCAVMDGAAESFQFGGAGRVHEGLQDGLEEEVAVEVAVQEAEVEELGVAEIWCACR
jgi:hypothetical protein